MTYDELAKEYENITEIARDVYCILALVAKIIKEPLKADEAKGLVSILNSCRSFMDTALPPPREAEIYIDEGKLT
jgi:hypothetical protein